MLPAKFRKEIRRLARQIMDEYHPQRIILYGSCARGRVRRDSDVDFLVVKSTRLPARDRIRNVYRIVSPLNYEVAFEPIVLTPAEMKRRLDQEDPFVESVLREGKVLYEKK